MKKRIANTDTTYCINEKCSFRNICERSISRYEFDDKELYWFCEFDEVECEKRKREEVLLDKD